VSIFSLKFLGCTIRTLAILFFFLGCEGNTDSSLQPKTPQELILSATEKQRIGAYDEAIEILHQALKLDSELIAVYYQMGLIYSESDQRDEAIRFFKKAIEMKPQHLQSHLGLGEVYSKMTRNDLAVAEFLKAESIKPNDTKLFFKIALEYWYDQKLNESAKYYEKVLAIKPDHIQTHLNLISVYEKMKDWEKAIEEIETSQKLGRKTNNDQAIIIAERKLAFIKGRMNMSHQDYKRKTQPPFD
jgi:tetratricopeptide (TPR) repeat protein